MLTVTKAVKHIIIINVLFWIGTLLVGANGNVFNNLFAMHFPLSDKFEYWQVITHMFMHASYTPDGQLVLYHILFNMFGVWMFGSPLERIWGTKKFVFFYISAGLGALLLYTGILYFQFNNVLSDLISAGYSKIDIINILNSGDLIYDKSWENVLAGDRLYDLVGSFNTTMVGASGALYGVLVAFALSFPNAPLMMIFFPVPIKAKYFVPGLLAIDLFFGATSFSIGPVAHFAHLGGALFGFIMAYYWKKNSFNNRRWD